MNYNSLSQNGFTLCFYCFLNFFFIFHLSGHLKMSVYRHFVLHDVQLCHQTLCNSRKWLFEKLPIVTSIQEWVKLFCKWQENSFYVNVKCSDSVFLSSWILFALTCSHVRLDTFPFKYFIADAIEAKRPLCTLGVCIQVSIFYSSGVFFKNVKG